MLYSKLTKSTNTLTIYKILLANILTNYNCYYVIYKDKYINS